MIWAGLLAAALCGYFWGLYVALRSCKAVTAEAFTAGHDAGYSNGQADTLAYLDAGPV